MYPIRQSGDEQCLYTLHSPPQIAYTPYILLLFVCYPLVVICDYFRRADIIFRPKYRPGRNADADQPEGQFFAFFRSKIHTPVFRIIIANVIQMIYLALLVITIENPNKKEVLTWYTFLTATFTIFFVLEDGMRSLQWKNFRRSFWNPYSLVLKFSFFVAHSYVWSDQSFDDLTRWSYCLHPQCDSQE